MNEINNENNLPLHRRRTNIKDGLKKNKFGYNGNLYKDDRIEKILFKDLSLTGINFDKYDNIPVETSGFDVPEPISEFNEEILGKTLYENLLRMGYTKPTPVQKYSISVGNSLRDMMACANTGSGKTAGYLLPLIIQMLNHGPSKIDHKENSCYPTSIIIAPTRELVMQIYDEASKFTYMTGIRPVVVYGGSPIRDQLRNLYKGCDILIGTPGRIIDLLERENVSLDGIRFLILDEADRMLDMGFEPQIYEIVVKYNMPKDRLTFMFSATFPKEIQKLASEFLYNYIFLTVGRVGNSSADIVQNIKYVDDKDKLEYVNNIISEIDNGLILIFVQTKQGAYDLENTFTKNGFPAISIHGDKNQFERERALYKFKSGKCPILVATDVCSRGIDINNITHVINYDMPNNIDDYVHRIGRTGRAGNVGCSISLMNKKNISIAKDLFNLLEENEQEIPEWLSEMINIKPRSNRWNGRGRRMNVKFNSRDYRKDA